MKHAWCLMKIYLSGTRHQVVFVYAVFFYRTVSIHNHHYNIFYSGLTHAAWRDFVIFTGRAAAWEYFWTWLWCFPLAKCMSFITPNMLWTQIWNRCSVGWNLGCFDTNMSISSASRWCKFLFLFSPFLFHFPCLCNLTIN